MKKILGLLLISVFPFISGCFGIGVSTITNNKSESYSEYKNQNISMSKIESERGKPDHIYKSGSTTEFTYYKKEYHTGDRLHSWYGVVVFIGIPVPIMYPQYDKTVFKFDGDTLISDTTYGDYKNITVTGCIFAIDFGYSGRGGIDCSWK